MAKCRECRFIDYFSSEKDTGATGRRVMLTLKTAYARILSLKLRVHLTGMFGGNVFLMLLINWIC